MPGSDSPSTASPLSHRHSWLLIGPEPWLQVQWQGLASVCVADMERGLTSLCVTGSDRGDMPDPSSWSDCLPGKQLVRMLGRRYDRIVIDWRHGWQTNHLSQVVGALGAGGQLIILLAHQEQWRDCYAWQAEGELNFFPWWQRQMVAEGATVITPDSAPQISLDDIPYLSWLPALPEPASVAADDAIPATPSQADAVATISRLPRNDVLVLTAERGYGKTLSLVLAARERAQRGESVLLTAALPDHLQEIRHWLARWPLATGKGVIHCLPWEQVPDPLLQECCVLVDEAAVLGLPRLRQLAQQAGSLVLATTTAGYEGSGLGFLLRFLPWLERHRSVSYQTLYQPVRWAPDDPVAWQIRRSLLHPDAKHSEPVTFTSEPGAAKPLDLVATLNTPTQRDQWVRLLAESHYQTRPDDLRQCLDNPAARAWGVYCDDTLAGLLVLLDEPPLSVDLGDAIWRGTRRPPDQLAKQSIIGQLGHHDAMHWRGARIWRLVVHPGVRRQGVASTLVTTAESTLRAQGADYLATAFGLTPDLLAFWRQHQFQPVRLGHQPDPASGSQSLLAVKSLADPDGGIGRWCRQAATALGEQWLLHIDQARQLNDPDLLPALAATLPPPPLQALARERLEHWAQSHQPESAGRHWLALGLWHWVFQNQAEQIAYAATEHSEAVNLPAWGRRLWRDEPWSVVQSELGLTDRKAVQRALRRALASLQLP